MTKILDMCGHSLVHGEKVPSPPRNLVYPQSHKDPVRDFKLRSDTTTLSNLKKITLATVWTDWHGKTGGRKSAQAPPTPWRWPSSSWSE